MKFRGLLIAVVVLAALGGFLFWSQKHPNALQPKSDESPAMPTLVHASENAITEVTVQKRGAEPITLAGDPSGKWTITAPITAPANHGSVTRLLGALSDLRAGTIIDDHVTDLSRYGLADPSVTVEVSARGSQPQKLLVGDATPTNNGVYAMVAGDPHVYTIPTFVNETFNQPVDKLRDSRLLPFNVGDVTDIELDRTGQAIVIDHQQGQWQIEKPSVSRASSSAVDSLLHDLVNAKFDDSATPEQAASGFAKAAPFETIRLTAGTGTSTHTDTLEIRKATNGGDFFGKASVFPGTWKLDPSIDAALTKGLDDLRNKQLFDFGFNEPVSISYQTDGTNLSLSRSNAGWFQNGRKMDADSVESLVSALRGLAASKLVTSGFTKPDVEITVVSQNSRMTEKVQLQKTKDGAIARREDGQTLYALDADTVNPLFSAASGVKPAAPAPPPAKK